jgi:hypothetical protein
MELFLFIFITNLKGGKKEKGKKKVDFYSDITGDVPHRLL